MKLVTIKESHNSNDLMILKSRLESEGIHCNLKDQYTSEVLSHIPSMSVKLQVYDSDLKNVKEIMNDMGEPFNLIPDIRCPNCNSEDVDLNLGFSDKLKLTMNYAYTQLFFVKSGKSIPRTFVCKECGNRFKC